MDLWDKIWKDKDGHVVIWQMPNVWLIIWAGVDFASIITKGHLSSVLWWIGTVDLGVWALLEVVKGVNYFRRALGLIVLLMAIGSGFRLF